MTATMSIGDLARVTGVSPGTLRTWERRHGFPRGRRTESGHRRFSTTDVEQVTAVLAARDAGLPLELAVRSVVSRDRAERVPSVYGAVTARHPELHRAWYARQTLVALSHAIEDECLARGDHPVVLGAFQQGHRFESSAPRWREIARTATWCAVVADFDGRPPDEPALATCDLPPVAPMRREWTVVSLGADYAAVLAAWERPGEDRYEAVLSTDPHVARTAARVLADVVADHGVDVPDAAFERLDRTPNPSPAAAAADRLLGRAAAHLDRRVVRA